MNEDTLTLELLKQLKSHSKRWFIAFLIAICMFFISNLAWLYAWNLPTEEKTEETVDTVTEYDVDQDSGEGGNNNYIGNDGDIYNGETKNQKDR